MEGNNESLPTRAARKAVADQLAQIHGELSALVVRLKLDRNIAPGRTRGELAKATATISEAQTKIANLAQGRR